MDNINFDGEVLIIPKYGWSAGKEMKIIFQRGNMSDFLINQNDHVLNKSFCYIKDRDMLIWKSEDGELFRMRFEKFDLDYEEYRSNLIHDNF